MHNLTQLRNGGLAGLTRLDLSCGLTAFPQEIFDLADSLEILNLSGNHLTHLPGDLPRLKRLKVIFLSQNQFTELPGVLSQCPELSMIGFKSNRIERLDGAALPPGLRWLILTDNRLTSLPAELGSRPALQKLMLAGNRLAALPESLAGCRNLELMRLAANELESLPHWLWRMPRLAWLAFGGNPCAPAASGAAGLAAGGGGGGNTLPAEIPAMPWSSLTLEAKLGEGASGFIHRAIRHQSAGTAESPDAETEAVAVKIFKGAVTSDGLPSGEMAACLAAGEHPNLIGVRGRITGHPEDADALVMPLISPDFITLAGPPSLESCTRDVYPDGFQISPDAVRKLASGIAAAAAHLHARGILHGDLYAHNILWKPDGTCLFGDFGAASHYLPDSTTAARAGERLEVRAFGCLLEELLSFLPANQSASSVRSPLETLRDHCLIPEVADRPGFAEISAALNQG